MKTKTILAFILLCIGLWLSGMYGPWYAPAFFTVVFCAILMLRRGEAILIALVAGLVIYAGMACYYLGKDEADIIAKTGNLLGGLSPIMLILVTTVIGGVTMLFSAWLGNALGRVVREK